MNVHEPTAETAANTAISRAQTEEANISSTSTSAASNDLDDDFDDLKGHFQIDGIADLIIDLEHDIENQGEESASSGSKPSSPVIIATTTRQSSLPSRTSGTEGEREGIKMKIMRNVKPGKREHKIVSPDLRISKVASSSTCNSSVSTNNNNNITSINNNITSSSINTMTNNINSSSISNNAINSSTINNSTVNSSTINSITNNKNCVSNSNTSELRGSSQTVPSISSTKECGTSTSIGTITDPDCLGPCEPGTSVTLEGIVWQETEGGILVVNVTWRGKTYVGTLLDCTKHDWAPPRLCESPASDIDSKTSKSVRAKRIATRSVGMGLDERALVQTTGKLRNGKGRRIPNPNDAGAYNKRQRKSSTKPSDGDFMNESSNLDQDAAIKGASLNDDNASEMDTTSDEKTESNMNAEPGSNMLSDFNCLENIDDKSKDLSQQQKPHIGLIDSSGLVTEESKTSHSTSDSTGPFNNGHRANRTLSQESCPASPKLISCSEPNCSKKYRDSNALLFHQTHAHGGSSGCNNGAISEDSSLTSQETLVLSRSDVSGETNNDLVSKNSLEGKQESAKSDENPTDHDSPAAYSDISDVEDSERTISKSNHQPEETSSRQILEERETEKSYWDKNLKNTTPGKQIEKADLTPQAQIDAESSDVRNTCLQKPALVTPSRVQNQSIKASIRRNPELSPTSTHLGHSRKTIKLDLDPSSSYNCPQRDSRRDHDNDKNQPIRNQPPVDDPYLYDDAPTPPSINLYNNGRGSMLSNNGRNAELPDNRQYDMHHQRKPYNDYYPIKNADSISSENNTKTPRVEPNQPSSSIHDNYSNDNKPQQFKQRQNTGSLGSKNPRPDMHDNFSVNRRSEQNFIPSNSQHNVHGQDNHNSNNTSSLPRPASSHNTGRSGPESNQSSSKHHGGGHAPKNSDSNQPPPPPTQEEGMKPSGTSTGPPPAPHSANYYFNASFFGNHLGLVSPFDPMYRMKSMMSPYPPGPPNASSSALMARFTSLSGSPPGFVPLPVGPHLGSPMPPNLPPYPPQSNPLSPVPGHPSRHLRMPGSGPSLPGTSQPPIGQGGLPPPPHGHSVNPLEALGQPVPSLVDDTMRQYARNIPR